jgi:hypothetical protein
MFSPFALYVYGLPIKIYISSLFALNAEGNRTKNLCWSSSRMIRNAKLLNQRNNINRAMHGKRMLIVNHRPSKNQKKDESSFVTIQMSASKVGEYEEVGTEFRWDSFYNMVRVYAYLENTKRTRLG